MKLRITLITLVSVVLALGLVGIAGAQSICDTITFTSGTAQPGGTDTLCGTDAGNTSSISVEFDGVVAGSSTSDEYGIYCVTFTVPADATVGTHTVDVLISAREVTCPFNYAVEAAATAPATVVPVVTPLPATLPSTGFMLIPAGGLLAGGLGMLMFRKRRR